MFIENRTFMKQTPAGSHINRESWKSKRGHSLDFYRTFFRKILKASSWPRTRTPLTERLLSTLQTLSASILVTNENNTRW